MIQVKNSTIHYINERALTFSENDLDDPQRVAVSLVSGTVVMAYVAGTIDYAANGNYERWTLKGYSTKLINNSAHYVYARLSRVDRTALVVFSVKDYNIDGSITTIVGKDENGEDITESTEPSPDYFFIKIGELTATDGNSYRELTYDSGLLSTDKGNSITDPNDMWELVKNGIQSFIHAKHWLTSFTLKGFITLIGGLIFKKEGGEEKQIVDVMRTTDSGDPNEPNYVPIDDTTIPTTAWVKSQSEDRYLKKYEPDETHYRIKFFDGIECGYFVKGMIGGSGTQFDGQGYGEMNGLTLREFLEVPELRFNRIDVVSGELWNSIAFGLVEKVDTVEQKCWIKLEERERAGLHVYDICRGIFADFGDGTQWEGVDECGFLHLYGFWTAYFTPTEIIENGEGVFSFRYQLKPGTTQHPTPSMKFAVYGNFVDKTRQASAYSTRTYKRYLNNVDTWVIDPDKHIYAQYGELNGLTIGGQTMTGYGSFQHNCYFTGTQIQFTPQQKIELQGESAYSVTLSDYEGVVTIDDEGNIIGGEMELQNVVSDGENVITDGENVVTAGYKLKTQVQAMRGSEALFYSPTSPSEGSFALSISSVGCTAMVINGVVVVTSVFYTERCFVTITVNCEGKASFTQTYHITAIRDGKNPIIADIDNEMDSVACDSSGKVLFGLPVSCTVSMWAGTGKLELDRLEISAPEGVTYTSDKNTGVIQVTDITQEAERTLPLNITAYASYGGTQYHKDLVFTVNKVNAGENALLYKLSPSASSVKVDDAGTMTAESIACEVVSSDGNTITTLGTLTTELSIEAYRGEAKVTGYKYGDQVSVNSGIKTVTFKLYWKGILIDVETIPIIIDGSSPLIVDLDNEMQSVACDENGKVLLGVPLSTGVKAFYGSKELTITSLTVGTVSGVTASVSGTTVTVTEIAQSAVENIRIPITVKATHDKEYTRTVYLIVNKLKQGDSAAVVDLVPSASVIKVDAKGAYTPTSISCTTKVTTGKQGAIIPTACPENYTMKYAIDGDTTPDAYDYGDPVTTTLAKTSVTFYLYYKGGLVDFETIYVVKDGAEPVKLDLDNEMQSVACDEKGAYRFGLPLSTNVKMYYGADELTISSLTVSAPTGVTVSKTTSSVTVTAVDTTKATAEVLNINISATASYGGETYTKSATLTVHMLRQGDSAVVLDLAPSVTAIKVSSANAYTPASMSCTVKQTTGKNGATTPSSLPSGYTMKYQIDSKTAVNYTNLGGTFSVTSATTGVTFFLYYNNVLVDRETIPVVKDGAEPVKLDLDNEMQSVACDEKGAYRFGLPLSTNVKMYYGADELTISSLTVSAPTGVTVSKTTSSVTVTAVDTTKATAEVLNINISATASYGGETYTKSATLTVHMLRQGDSAVVLDLSPSVTAVKVNAAGTYTPTSVSCNVKQTTGKNGATTPSSLPSGYTMKYQIDSKTAVNYTNLGGTFSVTSATTGITFFLYYNNVLVDRETIPVVKDGANGTNGKDGADGADGSPGADGEDAHHYSISPEAFTVGVNSLGSLEPSTMTFTCYDSSGISNRETETAYWYVYASNTGEDGSYVQIDSYTTYVASYTVSFRTDYKYYRVKAKPYSSIDCIAEGVVVRDGSNEAAGSMPYNCGEYSSTTRYYYNANRRDIVTYDGGVYMVKSFDADGYISGYLPTNSTYWVQASKDIFRAMDTALIDGANIAGFTFKNNVMLGGTDINNPTLKLDGINGEITALKGDIGDWTISNGTLTTSGSIASGTWNVDYTNTISANGFSVSDSYGLITSDFGLKNLGFEDSTWLTAVNVRNNQNPASRRSDDMCGIYLGMTSYDICICSEGGSNIFRPAAGNMSIVGGLAVQARRSVSGSLTSVDDFVEATGNITLPSASSYPGKIIFVKCNGSITISGSLVRPDQYTNVSSLTFDGRSVMFVSNGTRWICFACYYYT